MVNNPNFYSQTALADTSSITQITDGADFPHSGLIKALADGLGQNYAISGFNITPTNATQGSVATGSIMRDGKIVTVSSALNFTLSTSYTSGTDYGYHLIVVNSSDALALRSPTASNKVPHPTSGDTIVAVLTHTGTNPFNAQYLTVDKDENSVTIARSDSGTYTESLTIQSSAGNVTIKATEQDKDIIFNVNDGGTDTEVMRLDASTSRVGIGTASPTCELEIRGSDDDAVDLKVSRNSTQFTGIRNSDATGAILQNHSPESNKKTLYFDNVHDSSGSAAGSNNFVFRAGASSAPTEIVRIKDDGKVGIGTTSPSTKLEVSGTVKATAFQGFEYFRVNQKSGQHGASTNWGTAFYLQFANTTDFDKTANTTNIIVNNASPDYITLKAGGIYQIVASVEIFVGAVTDAVDMWVEFGNGTSSTTDRRHWGTARRQVRTSQTAATANWNAQKTIVIEIPSTDSDEKLYISALVNGSSSNTFNVGSYDDARTNVSITRLGDSNS